MAAQDLVRDLLPHYPLPDHLFYEAMDIYCYDLDAKCKSCDYFCKGGDLFFELPKLQSIPLAQKMMGMEKRLFWLGQDIDSSKALE